MPFYDVERFVNLHKVVEYNKPYRGSTNIYPLGSRRYSDRHFTANADGTYDVWYLDKNIAEDVRNGVLTEGQKRHYTYYDQCFLGTVHPDGTYEFKRGGWGFGTNILLTEGLGMRVHHDRKRGGTIVSGHAVKHPVFRGLRIDMRTGAAVTPYVVHTRNAKRKETKDYFAQYVDKIEVAFKMLEAMDEAGIKDVYRDLFTQYATPSESVSNTQVNKTLLNVDRSTVNQLFDKGYGVDALCLYTILAEHGTYGLMRDWDVRNLMGTHGYSRIDGMGGKRYANIMRASTNNHLRTFLLSHAPADVQETLFEFNVAPKETVPTSKWGIRVTRAGGIPVNRF